ARSQRSQQTASQGQSTPNTVGASSPTLPTQQPTTGNSSHASKTFVVQAAQDWQNTGVSIHTGNQVTIQYVSGLWTSDPSVSPFDGKGRPDGYTCANYEPASQCGE